MSRRINTISLHAANASGSVKGDSYSDRIVKFIPGDVVAGWLAITSAIKSAARPPTATLSDIFLVGLLFAAAWTWRRTSEEGRASLYSDSALDSCFCCLGVCDRRRATAMAGIASTNL